MESVRKSIDACACENNKACPKVSDKANKAVNDVKTVRGIKAADVTEPTGGNLSPEIVSEASNVAGGSTNPAESGHGAESGEAAATESQMECREAPQEVRQEDDDDELLQRVITIESLCTLCHKNGETRMLMQRIPHFKDILVSSFSCPHCGYTNRETETVGPLQPQGVHITLRVKDAADLRRQVVKGVHAQLTLPEVDLVVPPSKSMSSGVVTTVEGVVREIVENLKAGQSERRSACPEVAAKIEGVLQKLENFADGSMPFTLEIDDAGGNSYIECLSSPPLNDQRETCTATAAAPSVVGVTSESSPSTAAPELAPQKAPDPGVCDRTAAATSVLLATQKAAFSSDKERLTTRHYKRTREQLHAMGFYEEDQSTQAGGDQLQKKEEKISTEKAEEEKEELPAWALTVECPHCGMKGSNRVCEVDVPGFKRCLLFSFVCENCGAKESEMKPGGPISLTGRRWILQAESPEDLNREVVKGDNAVISIPSLDVTMQGGSHGGDITTVEGLIGKIIDSLGQSAAFVSGDSAPAKQRERLQAVVEKLQALKEGQSFSTHHQSKQNEQELQQGKQEDGKRQTKESGSFPKFTLVVDDCLDASFIGLRSSAATMGLLHSHQLQKEGSSESEDSQLRLQQREAATSEEAIKSAVSGETLWTERLDLQLTTEIYKRTAAQDEELGLTDMRV